ncbi:MAG: DUF192 domain-containing protein [Scytonematopsis contorta HA4267-MV1]|jgi:hypothetical protein|nr:DUF192 domain-containing protein [Scytonematopsis contorta HA4267-MV1]
MQIVNQTENSQKTKKEKLPLWIKVFNIVGPIAGIALSTMPFTLNYLNRQPQYLPIAASFSSDNKTIKLEVADEPQEYSHGLKFRKSIPKNQGMLFILKKPEQVKLWMKDTYVPLDMIFLQDGVIKTIVESAPPCKTKTCPKYDSVYPINQVIELPAGSVKSLELKPGKKIELMNIK